MSAQAILVYGGAGALGSACITFFKEKGWKVISVDLVANELADTNVVLSVTTSWNEQSRQVLEGVSSFIGNDKLSGVVSVAGGWAGGNAAAEDLIASSDLMWKQSVWTSVISGQVAAAHLAPDGVLCLTGARPALGPTPGMIGYGMAKAAVHQLVKSLAGAGSGISQDATVTAILPITLDTPQNRKYMPNADHTTWTPLTVVAEYFLEWITSPKDKRPKSGSFVALVTENSQTKLVAHE